MKISIVIPAYNEERYIGRCLSSIFREGGENFAEIIVVNNGSTDGTAEVVGKFSGARLVSEPRKGPNAARQRGLLEVQSELVAYLDADTEIDKNWLPSAAKEFTRRPDLVCLSGPFFYWDLTRLESVLVRVYWYCLATPVYFLLGYMAVGGNCVIKRDALRDIGGFDTSINFYGDDTNMARRLHKVGKVKFKASFSVWTSGRRFKGQGFFKTGLLYAGNFFSEVILHRPLTKKHRDVR
ncbi:MAG: glycosyltransferase family 2 protein [Candidatus Taylorbacteria bacterium]|nr:glycosyltransferase family 2 protein [Candidatus Taylorbacteria bacterium]